MNSHITLALFLCFALVAGCQKAQEARDDVEDLTAADSPLTNPTSKEIEAVKSLCDDIGNQPDAEKCAKTEFEKSETEINQLYAKIISDLKNYAVKAKDQDQVLAEKYKRDRENLIPAQESWLNYRKFSCKAEKELNLDANSFAFNEYSCLQRLTEERIEYLKLTYQNK